MSAKVEACLQLLRSSKDEEKFAGLLLVTRVFARFDSASLVAVLDAVDARFLARLLRHPTDTGAAYRTVALNILSAMMVAEGLLVDFSSVSSKVWSASETV